jgi:hypothetical protein
MIAMPTFMGVRSRPIFDDLSRNSPAISDFGTAPCVRGVSEVQLVSDNKLGDRKSRHGREARPREGDKKRRVAVPAGYSHEGDFACEDIRNRSRTESSVARDAKLIEPTRSPSPLEYVVVTTAHRYTTRETAGSGDTDGILTRSQIHGLTPAPHKNIKGTVSRVKRTVGGAGSAQSL